MFVNFLVCICSNWATYICLNNYCMLWQIYIAIDWWMCIFDILLEYWCLNRGMHNKCPLVVNIGPEGRPNNLPQPAWRLAELFFRSDLSWLQADLCADSYVISMRFSLLGMATSCTHYISYVGIERIIHNRIIRNMLFVELGPTGFQLSCNCTYFLIFE